MTDVEQTAKCPGCLRDLPLHAFGGDRSKADGRNTRCKVCERDRKRAERSTPEGKRRNVDAVRRHRKRYALGATSPATTPAP